MEGHAGPIRLTDFPIIALTVVSAEGRSPLGGAVILHDPGSLRRARPLVVPLQEPSVNVRRTANSVCCHDTNLWPSIAQWGQNEPNNKAALCVHNRVRGYKVLLLR